MVIINPRLLRLLKMGGALDPVRALRINSKLAIAFLRGEDASDEHVSVDGYLLKSN
jgi:hypothetical protein